MKKDQNLLEFYNFTIHQSGVAAVWRPQYNSGVHPPRLQAKGRSQISLLEGAHYQINMIKKLFLCFF